MKKLFLSLLIIVIAMNFITCTQADKKQAENSSSFDDQTLYDIGYTLKHIAPVTPKLNEMTLKCLWPAVNMGNGEAMVQLGEMYLAGRVPLEDGQDTNQEAMKWWKSAWEHGATRAYHNLGLLYYGVSVPGTGGKGVGVVEQDYDKAFKYFKAAADLGDTKAIRYVGICYENGYGVKQDYAKAAEYYSKNGDENFYYANLLLEGKGVEQNVAKAINIYEKVSAKESGGSADQYASEALARIYEEGRYVKADQNKALEYYKRAMDYGSSAAKEKLNDYGAALFEKGYALLKAGDYKSAFPMLLTSAKLGNADALDMAGTGIDKK